MNNEEIIGIVIASLIGMACIVVLVYYLVRKPSKWKCDNTGSTLGGKCEKSRDGTYNTESECLDKCFPCSDRTKGTCGVTEDCKWIGGKCQDSKFCSEHGKSLSPSQNCTINGCNWDDSKDKCSADCSSKKELECVANILNGCEWNGTTCKNIDQDFCDRHDSPFNCTVNGCEWIGKSCKMRTSDFCDRHGKIDSTHPDIACHLNGCSWIPPSNKDLGGVGICS